MRFFFPQVRSRRPSQLFVFIQQSGALGLGYCTGQVGLVGGSWLPTRGFQGWLGGWRQDRGATRAQGRLLTM